MQNAKCKMQNANANAKGKCKRLSVKPFIATALFLLTTNIPSIFSNHSIQILPMGHSRFFRQSCWTAPPATTPTVSWTCPTSCARSTTTEATGSFCRTRRCWGTWRRRRRTSEIFFAIDSGIFLLAGNQLYDWQTHGVLTLLMMMRSKNKHWHFQL